MEVLKTIRDSLTKGQEWVLDNLIILHVSGSRLYGTNSKDSDWDYRGITIAPKEFWVGLNGFDQWEYKTDEIDITIWDIRKWMRLAIKGNPNIIETLFVNQKNNEVYEPNNIFDVYIRKNWPVFLNQSLRNSFGGYAHSQYQKLLTKYSNKTGRQDLVKEFGFDTKFASHVFRLVSEGEELLTKGQLKFPRPDAQKLKDIRFGTEYSPDEMDDCLDDMKCAISRLDTALNDSILPKHGDGKALNDLQIRIFDRLVK